MMVQCLLTSRPNDALSYVSKAASFIANLVSFPTSLHERLPHQTLTTCPDTLQREAYPDDESRWSVCTSHSSRLDSRLTLLHLHNRLSITSWDRGKRVHSSRSLPIASSDNAVP